MPPLAGTSRMPGGKRLDEEGKLGLRSWEQRACEIQRVEFQMPTEQMLLRPVCFTLHYGLESNFTDQTNPKDAPPAF
jgi:hypothetical protein